MTDERKPVLGADGTSSQPAEVRVDAASLNHQTVESDAGRYILSASALAAAVAAIALPLVKVKDVEAQMEYCGVDNYGGFDIGDISDCTDCTASLPADCSQTPPGDTPPPSCSSCSSCSGCSGCSGCGCGSGGPGGDDYFGE